MADFSDFLLDLYRLAREQPLLDFHAAVLQRLQSLLAFDKAWWGRSAWVDGALQEHNVHLFGLPDTYFDDWQSIADDDVTAARAHDEPGRAVIIDPLQATSGLRWLCTRHGIGEFLCVIHINTHTGLSDHLSLYRAFGAARLTSADCELMDALIAHLAAAQSANQIRALAARREHLGQQQPLALAVCDHHGVLHCVEPGFAAMMAREWPSWSGARLPREVAPGYGYLGRWLRIESSAVKDMYLLGVTPRSPLDALSERELSVASQFGQGQTYKEIARSLGIAPNTVRHYIRTIYNKLDVHDKAAIAGLLHQLSDN